MQWLMKIYGAVLFVCSACTVTANDSIIVHKDARLDVLIVKQAQSNKRMSMMTSGGQYKGYRIQVLSTGKREEAFNAKAVLLVNFPDQKAYVMFQSPNFKVRIGNFLKQEEAEKFRKQLAFLFPKGAYIVEDAIEYIPVEEELPIQ